MIIEWLCGVEHAGAVEVEVPNICLYMADELLRSYEAVSDLDAVPLEWEVSGTYLGVGAWVFPG